MEGGAAAPDPILGRLRGFDSCVLSDAAERHGISAAVPGLHRFGAAKKLVGRASTVELQPAGAQKPRHHLGAEAIDSSGPGDVIVVAHHGRRHCAGWGGLLSLAALLKGIEGAVVDGACRDVDDAEDLGFTLYARAAVPITARGRVVERSCGEPVSIGPVDVAPGDLVLGDASGVVFLPARHAEQVLATAEEIAAREREIGDALRRGTPAVQALGAGYEALIDPAP